MSAATEPGTSAVEAPVLIAGGGLVGLTIAMFLAQRDIRSIAVERMRTASPLPRAAHFPLRTIGGRSTHLRPVTREWSPGSVWSRRKPTKGSTECLEPCPA